MTDSYVEPRDEEDGGWQDRGFSVQDLVLAVRRRWWAVAAVFLLVFGWSMWRTLRQERLYNAATTVRIQENPMPIADVMPQSGASIDWRVDRLLSEQQVIKSQQVAERVSDRL